ncbi:metallophosphoesterase [Paenibacillus sp. 1P07SE]|uniref:metallophosphoesterase n=1 Tax=Paenibacillus sp. 1P07SE TaxID=3132209 RepID=UPI0039A5D8AB
MRPIQIKAKSNRYMGVMLSLILVLTLAATSFLPHVAAVNGMSTAAADHVLVPLNSTWDYLEDGSDQGTAWRHADFDDSDWKNGEAPLGYASAGKGQDIRTTIGYGPDASRKPITVYFRQTFDVTDADAIRQLNGSLIRDDGAVIYLNGEEVFRSNLPAGEITHTTLATVVGDERDPVPFSIEPSMLREGTNLITAEVHQNAATSSDLYFSLELRALTGDEPKDRGLLAEHYTNTGASGNFSFDELKSTAIYPDINFSNLEPVHAAMAGRSDQASIRFTGQIMPEQTADYTFYIIGDNGFRLWIGDMETPIIDFWVNEWDKEQTSQPIRLEAGQQYDIKLDYFENDGGSNLFLRWSADGIAKQLVPASVFYQPADYNGPVSGRLMAEGNRAVLTFPHELGQLPQGVFGHFVLEAGNRSYSVRTVTRNADDASTLTLELDRAIPGGQSLFVSYDGDSSLTADGNAIAAFRFGIANESRYISYEPITIAMTLHGSAKTNRGFAWYTRYDDQENAPDNVHDSIVEVVPVGGAFGTDAVQRFDGESKVLPLRWDGSRNATFIGHKVLVEGLTPGTAYKYRLGSDDNWSETGYFTTEAENVTDYEFIYVADSQGGNTNDYVVWSNTLRAALDKFPESQFLVHAGDLVDAGPYESQWFDFFTQPQDILMNLPIQATVGNHEPPFTYENNFYHHLNYPVGEINNPLPEGSVYGFDYGDARIMVMNTMDMNWNAAMRDSFEEQIEWLRKEVAQTDKKWKIVVGHKGIYSLGGHSDEAEIRDLRKQLFPVFDELGIDMVLQGHDHSYVRTYQMYGDKAIRDIETNQQGHALNPDGTIYMINNTAGTKFYGINPNVQNYFGAVVEQPRKQVYTGLRMTASSLTLESYRLGEDEPFDTYTIVRDDVKPDEVKDLSSGLNKDGEIILSWGKPEQDDIRGFRIYEQDGKMNGNKNWSAYIPVKAGLNGYSYKLEGLDPEETYTFVVKAVNKRNNSDGLAIAASGERVAAPSGGTVDDGFNTFGWTNVPGFDSLDDYEYSVDGGQTWSTAEANPQFVGDTDIPAGDVRVRVKADPASSREAGLSLQSNRPYTKNSIHRTYNIAGELTAGERLQVDIDVRRVADYEGDAYVVFQLMNGNQPMLINAVPLTKDRMTMSQYFNASGSGYSVKVFVFDEFNGSIETPVHLAQPLVLK